MPEEKDETKEQLKALSERLTNLEAEQKAKDAYIKLLEQKVLNGPAMPATTPAGPDEKSLERAEVEKELKQHEVGELVLFALKRNLVPRQGGQVEG